MRIGETLTLPEKCEVRESGRLGLRYWPEKGGEPVVKWIPMAAEPIVVRAISELRDLCAEAREMARWMDDHPGQIKIDWGHLPEILTASHLGELLGHKDRHAPHVWAKTHGVPVAESGSRRPHYDPGQIIAAVEKHRPKSLTSIRRYRSAASISESQLVAALGVGRGQGLSCIKRWGLKAIKGMENWVANLERKIANIHRALAIDNHLEGIHGLGNVQVFPAGTDLSREIS